MVEVKKKLPNNDRIVVFNAPHPIPFMFHTGHTAYGHMPSREELSRITQEGYQVYIRDVHRSGKHTPENKLIELSEYHVTYRPWAN